MMMEFNVQTRWKGKQGSRAQCKQASLSAPRCTPKMDTISYEVLIDTDEPDHRLNLFHENIQKYGAIYNTIASGATLSGSIVRIPPAHKE
jgi:hypothetical protein